MKGVWRKTIGGLKPVDPLAEEIYNGLPLNAEVMAEITRPRSIQHHKLFFALLKIVLDNQEHYKSIDALLIAFKVALGHCDAVTLRTGQVAYVPKSIAFSKMGQHEFKAFWDGAVNIIVERFLPGIDKADLEREILEMVQ